MKKTINMLKNFFEKTLFISPLIFSIYIFLYLFSFNILYMVIFFLLIILLVRFSYVKFGEKQLLDENKSFGIILFGAISSTLISIIYMLLFLIFKLSLINIASITLGAINIIFIVLLLGEYLYSSIYAVSRGKNERNL